MINQSIFHRLTLALAKAGLYRPTLLIDQARLDHNLALIEKALPVNKHLRLVDKSLPSLALLSYAMERLNTRRLMSFHLPITLAVLEAFPDAEVVYGKPMPVKALEAVLNKASPAVGKRLLRQTTWLIDSIERLNQYQALAAKLNCQMQFVFEIDVGLRRGGFFRVSDFNEALGQSGTQTLLSCRGLVGYDVHAAQLPGCFGGVREQLAKADHRMSRYVSYLPDNCRQVLNTGGSKTILNYPQVGTANELSVGSALLKPTDFDLAQLQDLKPAVFIATPVLKVCDARLPGPKWLTQLMRCLRQLPKKGCFLYGGHWSAQPVYPPGLAVNSLWGLSSNQQFMALPAEHDVQVDDFAFFRPTQSEAILQNFGDIALVRDSQVVDYWPPIAN